MVSRLRHASRLICRQPGFPLLLFGNFMLGSAYSLVMPFMSLFGTEEVGMKPVTFGVFMTLTSLAGIVVNIAMGKWSDAAITRRTALLCGAAGGCLGYLGYAYVRDPVGLTVIGMTALALSQVCFAQMFAHGREELSRDASAAPHLPFLISVLRLFFSLAWTVGPGIGALIMVQAGYRGVFLGSTVMFALFLAVIWWAVPHRPHPPRESRAPQVSLRQALTRPVILAHFVAFVAIFAAHNMSMMNLPLLITRELGGTTQQVGIAFGIAPLFELPFFLWFGQIAAKGHAARLIKLSAAMAIVYYAALLLVRTPQQVYPVQILSAVTIAITTGVAISYFQDFLPGQAGIATAIYGNSFSLGGLLGYFAFGLLLPVTGHRGMFAVCLVLAATMGAILFGLRFLRPTPAPEPAETAA